MASLNRTWPYNPFVLTHLLLAVSQRGHLLLPCSPCPECRPQSQWNELPCIAPVRRTRRGVSPLGSQNSLGAVKKREEKSRTHQSANTLPWCTRTDSSRGKQGYLVCDSTFYQEKVYSSGSSYIRHRVRLSMPIPRIQESCCSQHALKCTALGFRCIFQSYGKKTWANRESHHSIWSSSPGR